MRLFLVDWTAPGGEQVLLADGVAGGVRVMLDDPATGAGRFVMEMVGHGARTALPAAPACAPTCRARLGDGACGIDMAGRRLRLRAEPGGVPVPGDAVRFVHGRARQLDGPGSGRRGRVVAAGAGTLAIEWDTEAAPAAGTLLSVEEGCDGRLATCAHRFGNAAAFRGEPHVPGADMLLSYGEP